MSVRCARKWVGRYRQEGEEGLFDRSSAPRRVANRTPEDRVAAIVALRRLRFTAAEIAELLQMALSTVSGILTRRGHRQACPARSRAAGVRYERARPGELVHIDVKRLGRIEGGAGKRVTRRAGNGTLPGASSTRAGLRRKTIGWEYVHVSVDDYSRLAYAEVLTDEKTDTAIGFLHRARRLLPSLRHHASSASSPTTAPPTVSRQRTRSPAAASASATYAPAPTGRRPTAKPNASSVPSSPAGPTAPSTAQAANAPPPLTAGSGTTTIDADTQPSATNPRSAEPTCSGPTPRAGRAACT